MIRLAGALSAILLALVLLPWSDPASALVDRVERDVAYGPDPAQRFDVYLPAEPHDAPVIIMVHGGAWARGDKSWKNVVTHKLERWLPEGFVFVSVNYRLVPDADPLTQAEDVALALAKAQSLAPSWGADPAKFVLMGHSAGAHLVMLLTSDPAIATRQGARPWLGTVDLDTAALDIPELMDLPHIAPYDRAFGSDPTYWKQVSPMDGLTVAPPPLMLVCSTKRSAVCPRTERFADKARSLGGDVTILPVDLKHIDVNAELGLPGPYTDAVDAFLLRITR